MAETTKARNEGQNQIGTEREGDAPDVALQPWEPPKVPYWLRQVLIHATDRVSESLATLNSPGSAESTVDALREQLEELHGELWSARWELCQTGGRFEISVEHPDEDRGAA